MPAGWLPYRPGFSGLQESEAPSSGELLAHPHAFTHAGLITAQEFSKASRERGEILDVAQLEELHRRRLLVPLFKLHDRPLRSAAVTQPTVQHVYPTTFEIAVGEGRVSDPSTTRYQRWSRRSTHLYSRYQLMSLRTAGAAARAMTARRTDVGDLVWTLPQPQPQLVQAEARHRALALLLEALAPRYGPRVLGTAHMRPGEEDDLIAFLSEPPDVERTLVPVSGARLRDHADKLLQTAHGFDPLGEWSRVVRIGRPQRWASLRFEALLAHEFRVAAELLLAYVDDLIEMGEAAEGPPLDPGWYHERRDRLGHDQRERSETILDFGLSDRPAVVVAVEGQTEAEVFPRVFELFGVSEASGLVQIVNRESIKGNIRLLARGFGVPRLDPDGYRGFRLRSHATALFLPVDPEGPSSTATDREAQRQVMIDEILRSIPPPLRTDALRADLEHLVHVVAWGDESFEYAHFSDRELARALRRLGGTAAPDFATVQSQISILRRSRANLEKVWARWPVAITKPDLVDELWPVLDRRLRARRPSRAVPIKNIAADIVDLAHRIRRVRELGAED